MRVAVRRLYHLKRAGEERWLRLTPEDLAMYKREGWETQGPNLEYDEPELETDERGAKRK